MIVCPVCEHQQASVTECEVCGKALSQARAPDLPSPALQGLETTTMPGATEALSAPDEPMPALDSTVLPSGPELPAQQLPDLQATHSAEAGEVPVIEIDGLESTRVADDATRTPVGAGPISCRFCQHVQATGRVCDRCGMRLPIAQVAPAVGAVSLSSAAQAVWVRCRHCGAPASAGKRCGDCGREVPSP